MYCVCYWLVQARGMVDRFRLRAKGGDGGNGCISLRRSRSDRRGKPDGENSPVALPLQSHIYHETNMWY